MPKKLVTGKNLLELVTIDFAHTHTHIYIIKSIVFCSRIPLMDSNKIADALSVNELEELGADTAELDNPMKDFENHKTSLNPSKSVQLELQKQNRFTGIVVKGSFPSHS
jgi:hypothetical protein